MAAAPPSIGGPRVSSRHGSAESSEGPPRCSRAHVSSSPHTGRGASWKAGFAACGSQPVRSVGNFRNSRCGLLSFISVCSHAEDAVQIGSLRGKRVALTTPQPYMNRLAALLEAQGAEILQVPTVSTEITNEEICALARMIGDRGEGFEKFCGIAFTSRNGIDALSLALEMIGKPFVFRPQSNNPFLLCALGRDSDALKKLSPWFSGSHVYFLTPDIATPLGLVEALGDGNGRQILCPVPRVLGLDEPFVVPQFLQSLLNKGWLPVRVDAYRTRWCGPDCAAPLLEKCANSVEDCAGQDENAHQTLFSMSASLGLEHESMMRGGNNPVRDPRRLKVAADAIIVTSTAEVEGLLKSFERMGVDPFTILGEGKGKCVVAAHGPVTAEGARMLGLSVDIVGNNFQSFAGVVESLSQYFNECP